MANTAFNHDPALTVAASNTTAGAAVKWVASKNLGESLIILDSGGNGRIGLAGDLDLITLTTDTVTVAGTVAATTLTGAGSGITALAAGNIATGTVAAARLGSNHDNARFLRGDNTWQAVSGGTTVNGTTDNAVLTYINSSSEFTAEANLTYTGNYLSLKGDADDTTSSGIHWGTSADTTLGTLEYDTTNGQFKLMVNNTTNVFTITNSMFTTKAKFKIEHTTGGALMDIKDTNSSGTGANGFIRWQDNGNAQVGYMGKGSSNGTMQIQNESAAEMTFGTSGYTRLTIAANGTLSGSATNDISDQRIKENIEDTTVGLAEVLQLRPVKYNFMAGKGWGEPGQKFYGFLAQEVEAIIPEAVETADIDIDEEQAGVKRDPNGIPDLKSVTMTQITTALVKAVQELNAKIDALGS